jgi:hypothetical protein
VPGAGLGLQVGVAGRVGGLADVADGGGDRGVGEEQVQVVVRGEEVQSGGAVGLGGEDGGEPVVGELGQGRVVEVHRCVYDAAQPVPGGVDRVDDPA